MYLRSEQSRQAHLRGRCRDFVEAGRHGRTREEIEKKFGAEADQIIEGMKASRTLVWDEHKQRYRIVEGKR